eukprot:TRINITY_DN10677_c0_g1_i1.p1 TRINITY_DN10677_c0_g1~~TRINITY_DN10677_c0_g1_i1.p1  ORF type:complete len:184 (-),score=42.65 TRINITY_DN10677_c0_g1_i1:3-554(-)
MNLVGGGVESLKKKVVKTVHSFEGQSELRNLITAQEALRSNVTQLPLLHEKQIKYLDQWASNQSPSLQELLSVMKRNGTEHQMLLKGYSLEFEEHEKVLRTVLQKEEELDAERKKLAKIKPNDELGLSQQREVIQTLEEDVKRFKDRTVVQSYEALTKGYLQMYSLAASLMERQLEELARIQQ